MANHKSALKRHRQSEKRRIRNHAIKSRVRNLVRAVREAVESSDPKVAADTLRVASRALDKAVTKGVLHRNNAARRISRLTLAIGKISPTITPSAS